MTTTLFHFFLRFALILTCALAYTHPALAEDSDGAAPYILVLGDSLSAAYGIDQKDGWVNLLRRQLKKQGYHYKVHNASISGDTTSNGLARLKPLLHTLKPAIVIIELGGNDGLRGHPPTLTHSNLTRTVALLKEQNAKVLLLGVRLPPNYGRSFSEKFEQVFVSVADSQQIPLVRYFLKGVAEKPELMQQDGIHPNAAAQAVMLSNVWSTLETLLKNE